MPATPDGRAQACAGSEASSNRTASRDDYIAEQMLRVLDRAGDRDAAL
jgi:hypothetical protein